MIESYISSTSIESDNFMLGLTALFVVVTIIRWKLRNHLDDFVRCVVLCWLVLITAIGAKALWFATARHTAPMGEAWNPMMFEWRWFVIMICNALIVVSVLRFVQLIDKFSNWTFFWLFAGIFTASRIMGYY
mgnify:CR=1 FL=1